MSGTIPDEPVPYPVNLQNWEGLTFFHWPYDVAVVQRLVPDELTVQAWDGLTWVGRGRCAGTQHSTLGRPAA